MKKTVSNVLKHLVCISLCIVVILPFYMVFINSLKPKAEAARMSLALPTEWHFETYLEVKFPRSAARNSCLGRILLLHDLLRGNGCV